ncbi:hypothetical protein OIU91_07520 [Streptomyces sp. NBC_01456]|uniref:hypothetical protein n=1 Tax=unclassified Streptomyces TaxID=2593676 RepID=UPI002E2EF518|nr:MULTISPECIES: hypothetical protein [unclassified Streptomyces]
MAIDQSTESQDSAPQNSVVYETPPPELVERAERAQGTGGAGRHRGVQGEVVGV